MKGQDCSKTCLTTVKISLVLTGVLIFAAVASAADDTWTKKANMPTARGLLSTCELNGKIYAIGGGPGPDTSLSAVEEYDPATDTWTRRANLPEAMCGLSTSAVDSKIYAIGGATSAVGAARSSVYVYDPATDTWMRKGDMPTPRTGLDACVVNGKIYVIGGAPSAYSPAYKTVEEYDPATDTWTRKTDMPTARCSSSAGVADGKIYVVGGYVGGPSPWMGLSIVEAYDPATDTWTRKADMPTRRFCHSVSAVDGKIYSIGGHSGSAVVSTVEEYDPATNTWTRKTPMPTALWGLSTSAVGGKIYAVGGASSVMAGSAVSTVEEYDTGMTVRSPDFNGDGKVDIKDLLRLIESWGQNDPAVDIAPPPFGDDVVDANDLEVLMSYWGQEVNDPTLIAHWTLDETEGMTAADSAGENDAIVLGSAAWQPAGGKIGGALAFDGKDDFARSGKSVLDPAKGPLSVIAWVKGGGPRRVIVSQALGADWLYLNQYGMLTTDLRSSGKDSKSLTSDAYVLDDQWHRVVLTWDGTNRTLQMDGVEVARDTQSNLGASSGNLLIGAGKTLSPTPLWSGLIDDVRIYDRAVQP